MMSVATSPSITFVCASQDVSSASTSALQIIGVVDSRSLIVSSFTYENFHSIKSHKFELS
jgi:hypothetical protein